jgi:hypothetical protein
MLPVWDGVEIGLILSHALHLHVLHALPMVHLGLLGSHALQAMDSSEIHGTDIRGVLITDAPAVALEQSHGRVFGEYTVGHQGALPFGALLVACRAAQPCEMLVCPRPGTMRDGAFTRLIEPRTPWMRA